METYDWNSCRDWTKFSQEERRALWAEATDEEKACLIISLWDQTEISLYGHPSNMIIENGKVYRATVDHKGAPELETYDLKELIEENEDETLVPDDELTD